MKFVLEDAEHGAANREVLDGWLADWHAARRGGGAQALKPVFDELPAGHLLRRRARERR